MMLNGCLGDVYTYFGGIPCIHSLSYVPSYCIGVVQRKDKLPNSKSTKVRRVVAAGCGEVAQEIKHRRALVISVF